MHFLYFTYITVYHSERTRYMWCICYFQGSMLPSEYWITLIVIAYCLGNRFEYCLTFQTQILLSKLLVPLTDIHCWYWLSVGFGIIFLSLRFDLSNVYIISVVLLWACLTDSLLLFHRVHNSGWGPRKT